MILELPRFSQTQFLVDGVCLSEAGMLQIKSLAIEQQVTQRKKRSAKRIASLLPSPVMDKEARFLATIESVVSGTEGKKLKKFFFFVTEKFIPFSNVFY